MKNAGIAHWKGGAITIALIMIGVSAWGADQPKSKNLKANTPPRLEVHEWGTFTTLHAPAGNGLSWYQDTEGGVSDLPSFVHTFRIGLKSRSRGPSTARMETPVLYFYTDQKLVVDVTANYVGGVLTEFYPQNWQKLELIPPREAGHLIKKLPIDPERPGNHYYEARAVPGAALVRSVRPHGKDGKPTPDEIEKFVFYRGVGTFDTRLMASLSKGNKLNLSHFNTEFGLKHAWVLQSSEDAIRWSKLEPILPWNPREKVTPLSIQLDKMNAHGTRADSIKDLADSMAAALIDSGLTEAEATAMIATWDDQWYLEPGQRIFTIPPQAMVDKVLPLKISPHPTNITRVFVHRQEVLSPETMEVLEFSMKPETELPRARDMIQRQQLGRFVHGAMEAVADRVANRTRDQYYARGLKAIGPSRKIDLDEAESVVSLRADLIPSEKEDSKE